MITIAHRLLAVGNADKVGVMEKEKVDLGPKELTALMMTVI